MATIAEVTQRQVKCYGCTQEEIETSLRHAKFDFSSTADMVVMGLLSDAQELIELGQKEQARQLINRAKYIVNTHLKAEGSLY